ncbi:MAG: NUDIX domain-containing protein [Promethearchaeota archaeon]
MREIKIIWEGLLNLDLISWGLVNYPEYKLGSDLDEKRKEYWITHSKKYLNDYDGILLYLYDFKFENDKMILNVGTIKFSTVIYMTQNKIAVDKGIGMLGIQCLIFSPKKDNILVGERVLAQEYYPGALTIPGGMLEKYDLDTPPKVSLMREVYEEAPLNYRKDHNLLAILTGWNDVSVTFLLSAVIDDFTRFNSKRIINSDKNEWENDLWWLSIQNLKEQSDENILDGLIYYRSKIKK